MVFQSPKAECVCNPQAFEITSTIGSSTTILQTNTANYHAGVELQAESYLEHVGVYSPYSTGTNQQQSSMPPSVDANPDDPFHHDWPHW